MPRPRAASGLLSKMSARLSPPDERHQLTKIFVFPDPLSLKRPTCRSCVSRTVDASFGAILSRNTK
jgi:hypothetical protein